MRILALAADPGATITQVRLRDPLSGLMAATGGELRLWPLHQTPLTALEWCDVLVVQRGMSRRHLGLIEAAASLGRAVVYEIDDLLTEPAPHLQQARALSVGARWVRACLEAADVVTISTARLGELLALAPGHGVVVPNAAYAEPITERPAQQPSGGVTLLVAASDRVAGGEAWQALRALTGAAGQAARVLAVGPVAEDLAQAGVPCQRLAPMPREVFVRWAASQPSPLAVIPLDASRFSAGKSAVKWFDYAVAGVPTLASDVPPHSDVIHHGRTGWLVGPTCADWQSALAEASGDASARARVAAAARLHVLAQHHAGLTQQAWAETLRIAVARAAVRGSAQTHPAMLRMRHLMQSLELGLRRWNRERLARRK
jgi:hypothetical protein